MLNQIIIPKATAEKEYIEQKKIEVEKPLMDKQLG